MPELLFGTYEQHASLCFAVSLQITMKKGWMTFLFAWAGT